MKKILTELFFLLLFLVTAFSSCDSSKRASRSEVKTDSSYVKQLELKLNQLTVENKHLTKTLSEIEYGEVVFGNDFGDNPNCDTATIKKLLAFSFPGANIDSFVSVIKGLKNKVRKYADGSLEFEGNIKSYKHKSEKQQKEIVDLKRNISLLMDSIDKTSGKVTTTISEKIKEIERKSIFTSLAFNLCLMLLAVLAGIFAGWQLHKKAVGLKKN